MHIIFVGGPWHGRSRSHPDPVPARIEAAPGTRYVAWDSHPATAGVLADALRCAHAYVLETLMPPHLLERVQHLLLHGPATESLAVPVARARRPGADPGAARDTLRAPPDAAGRGRGAAA